MFQRILLAAALAACTCLTACGSGDSDEYLTESALEAPSEPPSRGPEWLAAPTEEATEPGSAAT